jgi:hypothetical protein
MPYSFRLEKTLILFTPTLKGAKSKCYDWALVSDEYLLRRQVFFHPLGPGKKKTKKKS